MEPIHVAGLLLTGGASSRMGMDKASIELAGVPVAVRVARALASVAYPVVAVGRDAGTGLDVVDDPREGPLVAFVVGAHALRDRGHMGPLLLVASDLPMIDGPTLRLIAGALGAHDASVPDLDGREQPLAACYAPAAVDAAEMLVARGARAMRDLLGAISYARVPEAVWAQGGSSSALRDVDVPEDVADARRILEGPA